MTHQPLDVIVPLRNEAHNIPRLAGILAGQTAHPQRVIVADGMSEDGSRQLLAELAVTMPNLVVVDNPRRTVPAALNVALAHVESPVVARMDLHADYSPDYLERVASVLAERPDVAGVGGAMATAGRGPWGKAIASTLSRSFGLGGARHRVGGAEGPIAHVFSGCYRTSALREQGGWDERFRANEDFEADTRLREGGATIWLAPQATTTWFVRETPANLAIQMWRYGYYKSLTLAVHPNSLKVRQLAPPLVVLGLVAALAVSPRRGLSAALLYAVTTGTLGAKAALNDGASPLRGSTVPMIVHVSWGSGLLAGLVPAIRNARRPARTTVFAPQGR